jgi:hypothetical protein
MNKNRILFGLVIVVLAYVVYRLIFSYTIISVPIVGDTYEGGSKEQFDISILNPFYKKELHDKY